MADAEQYLMGGVSRDSSYQQDGTGVWAGRTGTPYTRTPAGGVSSFFPIIGNVDGDTENEIIIIEGTNLQVLNFTPGIGLVLEQSITHGSPNITTVMQYVTPSLFDINSDGIYEIISTNTTHFLMFSWNGTSIILNQSAQTSVNTTGTSTVVHNKYPVVKCAPAALWENNKNTCTVQLHNKVGGNVYMNMEFYNLDNNIIYHEANTTSNSNSDTQFHNTHLYDGDGDGYYEVYQSFVANGVNTVYKLNIDAANAVTRTSLIAHNAGAGRPHTDIILTKLDGAVPSVSWGFSSDNVNWNGYTINANTGAAVSTSYCTVLSCPEGDYASSNMWVDDGTYGDYSGDVCYYIRNYAQTDPAANTDTVYCLSEYAGNGNERNSISNNVNFSSNSRPIIHEASMAGVKGLLTPNFVIQGTIKETQPAYSITTGVCVPVDAQESGSLDIICVNATKIFYQDDAYTNQNVVIDSIAPDTGNSICSGETLTTTLSISDVENDAGNCYIRATYANGTSYSNTSNTTFTGGQGSVDTYFTYVAAAQTSFIHYYSCRDQYHSSYVERAYSVSYSNATCGSGLCNCKGYGTPLPTTYAANVTAAPDVFDTVWDEFGITSSTSKNILGLTVVIGVMVSVGTIILSPFAIVAAGILALIIVTFMGLVSAYILILTLVGLALIYLVLGKVAPQPGG